MYNRVVRVHKRVYEGLHRFSLNKMEDNDLDSSSRISDMQQIVNDFYENTTQVSPDDFIESDFLNNLITLSLITSYI